VGQPREVYSRRCLALTAVSAAAFVFGWFWVVENFSAAEAGWWNSWWAICGIFAVGIVTGLASRQGMPSFTRGTALWVFPLLNALSMLIFIRRPF
jgi:hypothetical protein